MIFFILNSSLFKGSDQSLKKDHSTGIARQYSSGMRIGLAAGKGSLHKEKEEIKMKKGAQEGSNGER